MPQLHVDYPVVISLDEVEASHVLAYLRLIVKTGFENVDWLHGIIEQMQQYPKVRLASDHELFRLEEEAKKHNRESVYAYAKRAIYDALPNIDEVSLPF